MARIPLPDRDGLSELFQKRWDRTAKSGPLNIQRVFFASPDVAFDPGASVRASGLTQLQREPLILRAAYLKRCEYEWHQHVSMARAAGLTDDQINAVRDWENSDLFTPDQRALLAYVDGVFENNHPSDEVFEAVRAGRALDQFIAINFVIAHYFALAGIMNALEIDTETPFVGWEI
jgi:4-carboxymuconolactone decarboxylase